MLRYFAISELLIMCCFFSCSTQEPEKVERDTTITKVNAYSDLFLDSIQVELFIQAHEDKSKWRKDFFNFYLPRNYSYAWFSNDGMEEQAINLMNLVNNAMALYDDSSLFDNKSFALFDTYKNKAKHNKAEVAETELLLTAKFFEYSKKMFKGTDSDIAKIGWFIPRKKLDYNQLLASILPGKNNEMSLSGNNISYTMLQDFLPKYALLSKVYFEQIPLPNKAYHKGDSSVVIKKIKDRLYAFGDLKINDSSGVFDTALYEAVLQFEHRMGLKEDGVIGTTFIKELNVTISERVQQILVNLERMRWMPAQDDSNHIFVNIPDYKMYVYDSSKLRFSMNVIVGKTATSTTIFSGNLKYVVFSPYWNVPSGILNKEVLPGIKRNKNYLANHNMEWNGGQVRQKPGPNNSLGLVKFLFPNSYDIYLHDTPSKSLFGESNRAFSHGCIRLGEPQKLAEYLLRNDPSWSTQKIVAAMNKGKEQYVTLKETVPVFIAYFTCWVDRQGNINFRNDVYGRDQRLAEMLLEEK